MHTLGPHYSFSKRPPAEKTLNWNPTAAGATKKNKVKGRFDSRGKLNVRGAAPKTLLMSKVSDNTFLTTGNSYSVPEEGNMRYNSISMKQGVNKARRQRSLSLRPMSAYTTK